MEKIKYSSVKEIAGVEDLFWFDAIPSTNSYAVEQKIIPKRGVVVIVADTQSAGKGQRGNAFFSEVMGGLWVSLVVRLTDIADHFKVNRSLSVAIASVLDRVLKNKDVTIKWPNDIYCGSKKICGILLESVMLDPPVIVAGFGLNVNNRRNTFPSLLQNIVTSVYDECGVAYSVEELLEEIVKEFIKNLNVKNENVHDVYCSLLYKQGSRIEINNDSGVFVGVGIDGSLQLQKEDGLLVSHVSGRMRFYDDVL